VSLAEGEEPESNILWATSLFERQTKRVPAPSFLQEPRFLFFRCIHGAVLLAPTEDALGGMPVRAAFLIRSQGCGMNSPTRMGRPGTPTLRKM
jgi:hypothetical protein